MKSFTARRSKQIYQVSVFQHVSSDAAWFSGTNNILGRNEETSAMSLKFSVLYVV